MIEEVVKQVNILLKSENSGHGMDHVNRVVNLSLKFAEKENVDKNLIQLIALLHDVDDYKLFGQENADNLTNAKKIMTIAKIDVEIQKKVCEDLKCIGYKKSLKGIRSNTFEGKIVSDADMCDALGIIGILRAYKYGLKIERPFFDKNKFPVANTSYEYHLEKSASTINFIFEVLLKYKEIMLTTAGQKEATKRHQTIIAFLYSFFEEQNAIEWLNYLNEFEEK